MKKHLPLLMLLSLVSAQTYETYGDPRDLSFPGGYIGLSVNYGTNKTIGFQASKDGSSQAPWDWKDGCPDAGPDTGKGTWSPPSVLRLRRDSDSQRARE